jgi:hypothetical protein
MYRAFSAIRPMFRFIYEIITLQSIKLHSLNKIEPLGQKLTCDCGYGAIMHFNRPIPNYKMNDYTITLTYQTNNYLMRFMFVKKILQHPWASVDHWGYSYTCEPRSECKPMHDTFHFRSRHFCACRLLQ